MKISSFIDSVKSPELAKRFSDKVPAIVNEMMERLDDFVQSEEAYASTELPKGEAAEAHRKLNHLVKDVRQRGKGSHGRDAPQPTKIINLISVNFMKDKKRKVREAIESWMNIPISFPTISSEDMSEEPLIVEAEVEGYLNKGPVERNPYGPGRVRWGNIKVTGENRAGATEEVLVNPSFPDQRVTIGGGLSETCREQLKCLLKDNIGVFAWEPSDMTVVTNEVAEWVKAGIVRPVRYPRISPIPSRSRWEMEPGECVLISKFLIQPAQKLLFASNIDFKVELVMGFSTSVFWIPTKATTKFKWPKRMKKKWHSTQIRGRRNLEAYVDDMVVKSKDEKMLLANIAKTFNNLKKINMKLNPKKCSFRVEEGKFLGWRGATLRASANAFPLRFVGLFPGMDDVTKPIDSFQQ
ncbi:reverse transcriptase domain-containing protein [Tanacetum coccineum]|uniref:Reverse transcriptase domain-containing protein n=1 Tax=Tanacetum coccineum TaxID=301880 RepID=A0ABQ5GEC0_9ASTR